MTPWYRTGRGWYVTLDNKQIPLGVKDAGDHAAAVRALEELLAKLRGGSVSSASKPVADAVRNYLNHVNLHGAAGTYRVRSIYLGMFTRDCGHLDLSDLTQPMLEQWCYSASKANAIRNRIMSLRSLFGWLGLSIEIRLPSAESAGADMVIDDDTYQKLLKHLVGDMLPYTQVLWHTGARPGEIQALTLEQIDWHAGIARVLIHKTARKTGKPRLIAFTPGALELLKGQSAKYKTGHCFRKRNGSPMDSTYIRQSYQRISKRIGRRVSGYSFRHTFATTALANGMSDAQAAALLGHNSTTMIHKHYSHINQNARLLADLVQRVRSA